MPIRIGVSIAAFQSASKARTVVDSVRADCVAERLVLGRFELWAAKESQTGALG